MNELGNKKFRSVLRDIVGLPLITMAVILLIAVFASVYSYWNAQKEITDANVNFLKISLNQLKGTLNRIEESFVEFAATDTDHRILKNIRPDTPREKYVVQESNLRTWLDSQANMFDEVQAAFAYYRNVDLFQFRGSSNYKVQEYVKQVVGDGKFDEKRTYWTVGNVGGDSYLLFIFHSGDFFTGEWLPWRNIQEKLTLDHEAYSGEVFLQDENGQNTLTEEELNRSVAEEGSGESGTFRSAGKKYYYFTVEGPVRQIAMGLLVTRESLLLRIPPVIYVLLLAAVFSVLLVTFMVLWLRKRIAVPVREVDEAMKIIAEGNLDYRLPVTNHKSYNEFDRLSVHFNAMMDKLDEAQFSLYESQLQEQKTKLKYVSQQIRPHFILNALNIIYTYDESEFYLVKKMVMYLTAYFRYIVNLNRDFVEVEGELEHTRNYLRIQKERYPHRFDYIVECGIGAEKLLIPPLIIQTFLENSIKYGMKDEGRSFFFVNVTVRGDMAEIFIADSGKGFDEETLHKILAFQETREYTEELGVGIQNTIERLDILYNGQAEVRFMNEETGGAVVRIRVPVRFDKTGPGEEEQFYT